MHERERLRYSEHLDLNSWRITARKERTRRMNILRFENNSPMQVALKYDGGREVDGSADTTLETQLRASIPGLARLEQALKTAIAAAAGAEQFGHEIGYEVHFAPVDIRAIAIDVLMNGSQDRPESTRKDSNHEQRD